MPQHAPYAIGAPETIRVVVPADALLSASEDVAAAPAVRIDAAGGSAVVVGTLIADTLPPSFVNETTRRSVALRLGDESEYGWDEGLATADSAPTAALLGAIEASLLALNATTYDRFEPVCANGSGVANASALTPPANASNAADALALGNASAALALNGTNASVLVQLLNGTNGTNATAAGPYAAYCASLINASVVNGSLVVHSHAYSPYCDPCLRVVTVARQPLNRTALSFADYALHISSAAGSEGNETRTPSTLIVELPPEAGLRATEANISEIGRAHV